MIFFIFSTKLGAMQKVCHTKRYFAPPPPMSHLAILRFDPPSVTQQKIIKVYTKIKETLFELNINRFSHFFILRRIIRVRRVIRLRRIVRQYRHLRRINESIFSQDY